MLLEFVLSIIIIRYLRRFLQKEGLLSKWDRQLIIALVISIAMLLMSVMIDTSRNFAALLTDGLLLYIIYIAYTTREFLPLKPAIYAVLPYVIVSIISSLFGIFTTRQFFSEWKSYF